MKNFRKIIIVVLALFINMPNFSMVNAQNKPKFSIQVVDYDKNTSSPNDLGRGDKVIGNGETVQKGQKIQVDILMDTTGGFEIYGMTTRLKFNPDLVEILYVDGRAPGPTTVVKTPNRVRDNDFFPMDEWEEEEGWKYGTPGLETDVVILQYTQENIHEPVPLRDGKEKRVISYFFKVREDIADSELGSDIKFEFAERSSISYGLSNTSMFISKEDGTIGTEGSVKLARPETPPENTKIDHISMTGNNGSDYLKDGDIKFAEGTTTYDVAVPNAVNKVDFNALLGSGSTADVKFGKVNAAGNSITDNGLDIGDNKYKGVVSDSTGKPVTEYNFNVRRLNNENVFDVSYQEGSDAGVFGSDRTHKLKNGTSSINIKAASKSKTSGYDYEILNTSGTKYPGNSTSGFTVSTPNSLNEFKVKFIPEEAKSQYDNVPGINANRAKVVETENYSLTKASNDTSIKSVTVKDTNSADTFVATPNGSSDYIIDIPSKVTNVDLSILLNDSGAKIMTGDLTNIPVSSGSKKVTVTAEDGTSKEYTFTFNVKNSDTNLKSLSVKINGVEKNENVNAPQKDTVITIDSSAEDRVTISGTANDPTAKVTGNISNQVLKVGDNPFEVKVTADDGSSQIYNVLIKVKIGSDLETTDPENPIEDESIEGEKDPNDSSIDVYRYKVNVKYQVSEFTENDLSFAKPAGSTVTVVQAAPSPLNVGDNNQLIFEVKSADSSTTARYIVTIDREDDLNTKLEDLDIKDGDDWLLDPDEGLVETNPGGETLPNDPSVDIYRYTVYVKNNKETFGTNDLNITVKDHLNLNILTDDPVHLNEGSNNRFMFDIVNSEKTSTSRYIITIDKEEALVPELPKLDIVSINDAIYASFDADKSITTINLDGLVDSDATSFKFDAKAATGFTATPETQEINIDGLSSVDRSIVVTDDNGATRIYLFKFTRTLNNDSDLGDLETDEGELETDGQPEIDGNTTTYKYRLDVEFEKTKFYFEDLNFTLPKGAKLENDKPLTLNVGDNNIFKFTVTSEDGSKISHYIITINRKAENSDQNESDLEGGIELNPGDDDWLVDPDNPLIEEDGSGDLDPTDPNKKIFKYTIRVKYEKNRFYLDDLDINIPTGAKLEMVAPSTNPLNLVVGEQGNDFTFEVTSGNGVKTSRYEILVIREAEEIELGNEESDIIGDLELDKDQTWPDGSDITDDSVEDENIDGDKVFRYTVNVENSKDKFYLQDFDYTLPKGASVRVTTANPLGLNVGGDNEFKFEVVSESGNSKSLYIITIIRADVVEDPKDSESDLEGGLELNPGDDEWLVDPDNPIDKGEEAEDGNTKTVKHTIHVKYEKDRFYMDDLKLSLPEGAELKRITASPLKLEVGPNNEFIFEVISKNGVYTTRYEVTIIRAEKEEEPKDPNDDKSQIEDGIQVNPDEEIVTKPGDKLPEDEGSGETIGSNPNTKLYKHTITVKYEKDKFYMDDIRFTIPEGSSLIKVSNSPLALNVGSNNKFIFEVLSANGEFKSRYEITIIRENEVVIDGSDESDLIGDLELDKDQDWTSDGSDLEDVSKEDENTDELKIYRYNLSVKYEKDRFYLDDFEYKLPANSNLVLNNNNPLSLNVGLNQFSFDVVSESGKVTSKYVITITREDEIVIEKPHLVEVLINDVKYDAFDKDVTQTTINLDDLITGSYVDFKFEVVASVGATATKTIETILVKGLTEITRPVIVQNAEGEVNIYAFTFTRSLGQDNDLKDIVLDNGTLKPEFTSDETIYELEVDSSVDKIDIEGISKDPNATVTGDGEINLKPGKNIITITVTPEDGGNSKDYFISVIRKIELVELVVDDIVVDVSTGVMIDDELIFNIGQVPSGLKSGFVFARANHSSVTFEGNANKVVNLSGTSFEFKMLSEDLSETITVIVNYTRDETDETGIDKITVDDGKNIWAAEEETDGSFTITVDKDTDIGAIEDNIKVELEVPGGEVTIGDPTINPDGSRDYVITVEDKNGNKTEYELTIKNDENDPDVDEDEKDNNYLKSISYNGNELVDFSKLVNDYTITIGANEELDISAIAEDPLANVIVGVEKNNKVEITVISQSGLVRTYRVNIAREDLSSTSLEDLKILEANMTPVFKPNLANYYVTIPNELSELTLEYKSSDGVNEVSVSSDDGISFTTTQFAGQFRMVDIPLGTSVIEVLVEANSGSVYTYSIQITRTPEADNMLDGLKVLDQANNDVEYKLTPEFASDVLAYVVTVPFDVNNFTVDAQINSDDKRITSGDGDLTIPENSYPYVHHVRVADKQNVMRNYSITFIKAPSENASLGNITTNRGALSPVFERDKFEYNITVDYEILDIDLIVTKNSMDQVVVGDGVKDLAVGLNSFEIEVTSGSKSNIYTINVTRLGDGVKLDWLTVSEGELTPEFNRNHIQYRVKVDYDIESIIIDAGSNNPDYTVEGIGEKELDVGINMFQVTIKADEDNYKVYHVVVDRAYENEEDNPYKDDLSLALLTLTSEELNEEFAGDLLAYTSDFQDTYPEGVDLVAYAINPDAVVTVEGNTDLVEGIRTITITVTLGEASQDTVITVSIDEELKLMSDIHEVGEEFIATVKDSQTVLDLKNQMLNPNEHLQVYKDGELIEDSKPVGTGAIIKLVVDGIEHDQKTIVVLGDVSGDGRIRSNDFQIVRSHILEEAILDIPYLIIAGDVSKDGRVRSNDVQSIQAHILEESNIHE